MTTEADFRRKVGTDPSKWAEAFWQAYSREERERPETERQQKSASDWVHSFTVRWFRDAMDAAAARAKWDVQGDCLRLIDVLVAPHDE